MAEISKKVLEKIKKENIHPIPKWQFMLKDSFVWSLFALNLILGSIGFAIIIFLLVNNDSVGDFTLTKNIWQWFVLSIPVAWILLTGLFLFVAFYNFKNTEKGYRFSVGKKVLLNVGITVLLGFMLYSSGFSERLNNIFTESVPFYTDVLDLRQEVWMRPQEGYLSGTILEINKDKKEMLLRDLDGKVWSIAYGDALVKGRVTLAVGERIKLLGKMSSSTGFDATEIRPWEGRGREMQEK